MTNRYQKRHLWHFLAVGLCLVLLLQTSPLAAAPQSRSALEGYADDAPIAEMMSAAGTRSAPHLLAGKADLAASGASTELPPWPAGLRAARSHSLPPSRIASLGSLSTSAGIPLAPGWNLISIPEDLSDTSPEAVLSSIAGQYSVVVAYDGCNPDDPWRVYDPNAPANSNLSAIDHRIGFWVYMTGSGMLSVSGSKLTSTTIRLCEGWNLVGYPLDQALPVAGALASIEGKYSRVFTYDPLDQLDPWQVFEVGAPVWVNDIQELEPGRGYWILANANADLVIAPPGPPPAVAIVSPAPDAVLTGRASITGTVSSNTTASWVLEYHAEEAKEWTTLTEGEAPVLTGTLGTLDSTLLLNGLYEIRLRATDLFNQSSEAMQDIAIEGEQKVGVLTLAFVDMTLPLAGIPIQIVRTYDSRVKDKRDFGIAWSLDMRQGTYRNNRIPGDGWQILRPLFGLPCTQIKETLSHVTIVRLSDREYYRFRPTLNNVMWVAGGCVADFGFEAAGGTYSGARLQVLGNTTVLWLNETNQLLDFGDQELGPLYNPQAVRLTTPDGRSFELTAAGGIRVIEERNGNYLVFDENGIHHSTGRTVAFSRDDQGRITRVTDPMGYQVNYTYDPITGDLLSVQNQVGQVTRYQYSTQHPHLLSRIIGPDGQEVNAFDFDVTGRLVKSCGATIDCVDISHDLTNRTETVTDATNRTFVYSYDQQGNIVSITNALSQTVRFEYDAFGNMTRLIDGNGNSTVYTYDQNHNLLTVTEPHDPAEPPGPYTTYYQYNVQNQPVTITLPTGAQLRMEYDTHSNLLGVRDENDDLVIGFGYSANGAMESEADAFGVTRYVNDKYGNAIKSIDVFSQTASMSYDAGSRLRTMTMPGGTMATFGYDGLGRSTTLDYGDGITLTYSYASDPDWTARTSSYLGRIERSLSPEGRVEGYGLPDGRSVAYAYDAAGRFIREMDPGGSSTSYQYDLAGRLEKTTDSLGATTTLAYDPGGRVIRQTDALSNTTSFSYTPNGRPASVTNARGFTWTYTYSPTQTTVIDPLGRRTTNVFSPQGLLLQVVNPDGATQTAAYALSNPLQDAEEYPTSITDEGGHVRTFTYSAVGQLQTATDLGGNVYTYTYDLGDLTTVTGPTGESLFFTYDDRGNRRTVAYAGSSPQTTEYGPGNLPITVTQPSGAWTAYSYDTAGRLAERHSSQGESASYVWNTDGQLASVENATGTTNYTYDAVGNLKSISYSSGASIQYERDLLGRVTMIKAQTGSTAPTLTTSYGYDEVGNLTSVVDPLDGRTTFVYDAVDRLIERRLPNGVVSTYTYNTRDQVTSIVHRRPDGSVLSSVAYERQGVGEPRKIIREDGSYVVLSYDSSQHLTREQYYSTTGTLLRAVAYTYDSAGNRLSRTEGPSQDVYSYIPSYRLVRVQGPTDRETYAYDADGRVTLIARDGLTRTLGYAADDHLLNVNGSDGTSVATYVYDGQGRRAAARDAAGEHRFVIGPATADGVETTHLVLSATGSMEAGYVFVADQPLMRFGPDGPVYYLGDDMGSVLTLADGAGQEVATFRYDGFGNLLSSAGSQSAIPAAGGDFRFHGAWLDGASGLYHLQTRDYDPRTGRFISRDPAEADLKMPESLHPYAFANSNPHLYRDPTGLFFTLASVSININISQGMQSFRAVSAQMARDYIRDKIEEITVNILATMLAAFLPGSIGEIFTVLREDGPQAAGLELESLVRNQVCGFFRGDTFANYLWLEPQLSTSGKPLSNGFSCNQDNPANGRIVVKKGNTSRPDFMFKKRPPTELNKKAWVIGDIKLSLNTLVNKYFITRQQHNQWESITNHAKIQNGYQYVPLVLFLTFFRGKEENQRRLLWEAERALVVPFVIALK